MGKRFCSICLQVLLAVVGTVTAAQTVAELLEQGVYTEETVGDLDAAIAIYDQIVNDAQAERPYIAQALFRRGQCLLKSGKKELAVRSFEKLIAEYPDQGDLVAQAKQHLPPMAGDGLAVDPAPWEDGELLRFVLKSRSGEPIGDLTYSVKLIEVDGREAWRMESYLGIPKAEIAKYSLVDTDRDSALPLHSMLYHSQLGTLRAEFGGGERKIEMSRPGAESEPYTQTLSGATYDNEQAVYLSRRLPLAEGYETSFLLTGRPGVTAMADLKVVALETITVPAGTFECFKVEIGSPPRVETHWISNDRHRHLVQVANPEISVELTEISRLVEGHPRYSDDEAGFSLAAPRGWDIMKSAFRFSEHEFWLLLFSPEFDIQAVMISQKLDTPMTAREFADMDVDIYRQRRKQYDVREDSWTDLEVAGSPAVSLLADVETHGAKMVEHRVYIAGPSAHYWFVFRSEPDVFESMKSDIDFIVDSLKLR